MVKNRIYKNCIFLGMQKLRKDHAMALENYVNINDSNVEVFGGAIGNIHFLNKSKYSIFK